MANTRHPEHCESARKKKRKKKVDTEYLENPKVISDIFYYLTISAEGHFGVGFAVE